ANTYYYLQDYIQSLVYLQKAIQIKKKSLSKGHPDTIGSIDSMEVVLQAVVNAGQGEEVREYIMWYNEECKEYLNNNSKIKDTIKTDS
ncbi:tetratricopeptide repeat protein, partial [Listeria monocytogenes]|uniref:tetratricopeptide repeat protein n=1 Tax=Listeria monocytogenes TaxID=1639 RepID=UPI002FDC2892